jgi:hypothetical protein
MFPPLFALAPEANETFLELLPCGCTLGKVWGIYCGQHAEIANKAVKNAREKDKNA